MPQSQPDQRPYFRSPCQPNPGAPLFIYLPGMDGTGNLLSRQLDGLGQFNVRCLAISPMDMLGWEALTDGVLELVELELSRQTYPMVYLCGESFGGCLALKLMQVANHRFDRLILINSASAFHRQPWLYWPSLLIRPMPEVAYRAVCVVFLSFLAALERIESGDRQALLEAVRSVSQDASRWRLSLLREFTLEDDLLKTWQQPALLVGSGRDRLLPSVAEAQRLADLLPNSRLAVLPDSGHACLLESAVNLGQLMQAADFMPKDRSTIEVR